MKNGVCYSVAVYAGLLLAGSLITSRQAAAGPTSLVPPSRGQTYGPPARVANLPLGTSTPATQPATQE
jgi:hypothetical protein